MKETKCSHTHTRTHTHTHLPLCDEAVQGASPLRRFLLDGEHRRGQCENGVVGEREQRVQPSVGRQGSETGPRVLLAL